MKIHAGALCKVVGGTDGLNIGKIVEVTQLRGEHSELGRIWRCRIIEGDPLVTEYGAIGITADFAQSWLQPIPPVTAKPMQLKIAA